MIGLALGLALALSPAQTQDRAEDPGFTEIWVDYAPQFEAEGITRRMAYSAYVWSEGQYHLGLCRAFLDADDVKFWREWWANTSLGNGPLGGTMLRAGSAAYTEGLETALTEPLTSVQCSRVLDSWFADMKAANDAVS